MDEVITLEKQRFTGSFGKRVSKAVAEIQFGGMSAALTEIAIGLARNPRLSFGDRFNSDARFFDKTVEAAAGDRISASVDHQRGFNEVGSGRGVGSDFSRSRGHNPSLRVRREGLRPAQRC